MKKYFEKIKYLNKIEIKHVFFNPITWEKNTLTHKTSNRIKLYFIIINKRDTLTAVPYNMHHFIFKVKQVHKTLLNLATDKYSGQDDIPPIVLKECAIEIAPSLTLRQRFLPEGWKDAWV